MNVVTQRFFTILRQLMPTMAGLAGLLAGAAIFTVATSHVVAPVTLHAQTSCGGEGERGCCLFEKYPGQECDDELAAIPGCAGNEGECTCKGGATINVTCVRPTPCGAEGERACIVGERFGGACNEGLVAAPGCSGDCVGKAAGSNYGLSVHTCVAVPLQGISEPTTNATPAEHSCTMSGYADLHLHLFADLAHGGGVLAGEPYDYGTANGGPGGINNALWQDFTTRKNLEKKDGGVLGPPVLCPSYVSSGECQTEKFFHGDHDLLAGDSIGAGTKDGSRSNLGVPVFNGWPKWTSTTHQQTYYKWLERAYQGGLRMVSMLAVTNEALCRGARREVGTVCTDSMDAINQQIEAAKKFEKFIADHHGGWFKIVYTPREARLAIARGKLAVVLGIETAELFNCKFPVAQCDMLALPILTPTGQPIGVDTGFIDSCEFKDNTNDRTDPLPTCTPAYIQTEVQRYYDMGVRHVFPVHNFDNAFGASASWMSTIEIGNRIVEDHWWKIRNCSAEGYGLSLGKPLTGLGQQFIGLLGFGAVTAGALHGDFPACNEYGLFPLGKVLIQELMKRGMIIDVDHMSARAFDETLAMAANPAPWVPGRTTKYPVIASHVQSFDMHFSDIRHERMRTAAQLTKIKNVGGMIAAMLKDDVQDTDSKGQAKMWFYAGTKPGGAVLNSCRHSSRSFADAYQYAVDIMGGSVALGSDFNGSAGHFGPRFGSEACGGWPEATIDDPFPAEVGGRRAERSWQYRKTNKLQYPFTFPGFGTFQKQVTGLKTFDYNVDGMAHIGLLPDFVKDLEVIGLAQGYTNELWRSAEAFVQVWERATGDTPPADTCALVDDKEPPAVAATVTPAANAAGWHRTNPTVTWQVTDNSGILSTQDCDAVTLTTETSGNVLTCTATDLAGNSAQASVTIRLDKTAPDITGVPIPVPNASGWNNTDVTVDFTCTDDLSGVADCSGDEVIATEGGNQVRIGNVTDRAGNSAMVIVNGISIDKTQPTITASQLPAKNGFGWNNTDVTLSFDCADELSGVASCSGDEVIATEGGNQVRFGNVTDRAGNSAMVIVNNVSIDKTPPTLVFEAPSPAANAYGWHATNVSIGFTASDALSGVASTSGGSPLVLAVEGTGVSGDVTVTDRAGNSATFTSPSVNIDKTPPLVTCSNDSPSIWPPNGRLVTVRAAVGVDGGLSGAAGFTLVDVVSSEADNARRDGSTVNDLQNWVLGTADVEGQVRAERSGGGQGRIYSLIYEGIDRAGNAGACTTTVLVPHDRQNRR
jgi:microsomal dipeptidase-like Zn-dependent dipeptidase